MRPISTSSRWLANEVWCGLAGVAIVQGRARSADGARRVVVLLAFEMLCPACVDWGAPQATAIHEAFPASAGRREQCGVHGRAGAKHLPLA
jgi:hypothetical protein